MVSVPSAVNPGLCCLLYLSAVSRTKWVIRVDSCPFVVETPLLSAAGITRFHRFTMQVRGNVGEDLTTNEHEFPRMPDEETFFVGWKSV